MGPGRLANSFVRWPPDRADRTSGQGRASGRRVRPLHGDLIALVRQRLGLAQLVVEPLVSAVVHAQVAVLVVAGAAGEGDAGLRIGALDQRDAVGPDPAGEVARVDVEQATIGEGGVGLDLGGRGDVGPGGAEALGVTLLVLTLLLSFTGYLLPWDQLAFWAITVGTSVASYAPGVGDIMKFILIGGPEVGQESLTRFYSLHVMIVPAAILLILSLHLWRVRKDGGLAANNTENND